MRKEPETFSWEQPFILVLNKEKSEQQQVLCEYQQKLRLFKGSFWTVTTVQHLDFLHWILKAILPSRSRSEELQKKYFKQDKA